MNWAQELNSWSHPDLSRRVGLAPIRWHVQEAGHGPLVLLLHGAGASTHTWRDLIGPLAAGHRVIALDLPGHGFSEAPLHRLGLDAMVEDLEKLIVHEGWQPQAIVGHSAGAAIALEISRRLGTPQVVGINPALENFEGVAQWLFPAVAKLLAINPFTANLFSFAANRFQTQRIIGGTGSQISDEGLRYYTKLMQDRAHVNGALQMMAQWSLTTLQSQLGGVEALTLFLVGQKDKAVPPAVATRSARAMPSAYVESYPNLGHLAHEEAPSEIAARILDFLAGER